MKILLALTCLVLIQISLTENVHHESDPTTFYNTREPRDATKPMEEVKTIAEYFFEVDAIKSLVNNILIWANSIVVDIIFDRLGLIES